MSQPVDPHQSPYPAPFPAPGSPAQFPAPTGAQANGRVYPSRKPWLRIGLITVAAVVALCAAVVGVSFAIAPNGTAGSSGGATKQAAGPQSSTSATAGAPGVGGAEASAPAGSAAPGGAGTITVVAPATLGGQPRIDTTGSGVTTDPAEPEVTAAAQGAYGNTATEDITFFTAFASTSETPEARLDLLTSELSKKFSAQNFVEADPGPLGGLGRCSDGLFNGVLAGVCVWSDAGSSGAFIRTRQSAQVFAPDFPALRAEVEQRS
ncbi:hypothetical protein [Micromonospora avicenniae]|uniref:hypothetical protein n=1 Tax=Micromonospora avicenniae TaxID=1198245 RepID=UPI0033269316